VENRSDLYLPREETEKDDAVGQIDWAAKDRRSISLGSLLYESIFQLLKQLSVHRCPVSH